MQGSTGNVTFTGDVKASDLRCPHFAASNEYLLLSKCKPRWWYCHEIKTIRSSGNDWQTKPFINRRRFYAYGLAGFINIDRENDATFGGNITYLIIYLLVNQIVKIIM